MRGAWLIVATVVANGISPYLEIKNVGSFNMYANLVTAAGDTNHLVVRRTLHLRDVQGDLLEVVRSNDAALDRYANRGYLVPETNLLDYLARHPEVQVVVRDEDGERTLTVDDGVQLPLVVRKLFSFRSVDTQDPPRCQAVWLPAL